MSPTIEKPTEAPPIFSGVTALSLHLSQRSSLHRFGRRVCIRLGLRLERLRNEVQDRPALLRRGITARPEEQRQLLKVAVDRRRDSRRFLLTGRNRRALDSVGSEESLQRGQILSQISTYNITVNMLLYLEI
jgi:hypothetical protein